MFFSFSLRIARVCPFLQWAARDNRTSNGGRSAPQEARGHRTTNGGRSAIQEAIRINRAITRCGQRDAGRGYRTHARAALLFDVGCSSPLIAGARPSPLYDLASAVTTTEIVETCRAKAPKLNDVNIATGVWAALAPATP